MPDVATAAVAVTDDPAASATLPGWVYTSEDILAAERERIFFRGWHYIGAVDELVQPGDYVTARLLDQSVFVMRGRDGALRGFYNVCQHRAHELLEGRGHAPVVTCPYHAWSYHDDGRLRSARGAERQAHFPAERLCLKPVRIEVFARKLVFYTLDPQAPALHDIAGDLEEDVMRETPGFDSLVSTPPRPASPMAANWKVLIDNFCECYHCGPAHPEFADLVDMNRYRTTVHGVWSKGSGTLARLNSRAFPVAPDANHKAAFWFLWPTTTIGFGFGAPSLYVTSTMPLSAGSSVRRFQSFALPGAEPDEAKIHFGRNVLAPQDVALCESVQRGLASRGYSAGHFVHDPAGGQTSEVAVHHFHRLYAQAMGLPRGPMPAG